MRAKLRVAGSVVAVTGGARGIGAAIAATAARRGARVAIGDVDIEPAERTAAGIGAGAVAFALDVTTRESWEAFVARTEEQLGPVDVLVNNAGIMPIGPFIDETDATTARQLAINVHGVLLGCKAVIPGMLARGRGALINIASQAGKVGLGGNVTYAATKWGVVGLSHALDDELRSTPVSVSCVLPGMVNTELSRGLPQTRWAPEVEPEEIAEAVVGAIERPRREIWVPRSGRFTITLSRMLPARVRGVLAAISGAPDPVLNADPVARAGYEGRVATSTAAGAEDASPEREQVR
jgi:NADP-dependent 3-hydroxy acid dehydrogenase YdfG